MHIERQIKAKLTEKLKRGGAAVVLYGARQVGKTTLMREVLSETEGKILMLDADKSENLEDLSSRSLEKLRRLVAGYDVLFIDEAQRIPNIGINLKILIDNLPDLRIAVTGSSSLDLASSINEPLTGRKWTYSLFPISFSELRPLYNNEHELFSTIENRLVLGSYPKLFNLENKSDQEEYLTGISKSSLYKDILSIADVKYPLKLRNLLELLAYQIGSQVSISELSGQLNMDSDTAVRYIDLLEQSFIIFRLGAFSRNLRKEVTTMDKIYFYDLGIRNALIGNFNDLDRRNDIGQLWENFLMIERMKKHSYAGVNENRRFWRTYTGAELDLVEERGGELHGFEFTWKKKKRQPETWLSTYSDATYKCITQENCMEFIT